MEMAMYGNPDSRFGFRPMLLVMPAVAAVLALAPGCSPFSTFHPETYGYVYKIGNSEQITRWTLQQTEEEKISDGMFALARMQGDVRERERAAAGFLKVHEKLLGGWPGFRAMTNPAYHDSDDYGDLPTDPNQLHLELIIRRSYRIVTTGFTIDWYPTFLRMKPDPSHHGRMEAWMAEGRRVGVLK
jgi:hypothetical protein